MFKYIVFAALMACVLAGASHSSDDDVHAEIKELKSDVRPDGFNYALDTTNSIHTVVSGDEHGSHKGFYEYVSPDGQHVKVDFVADENGFQPSSNLLPTPPPVPEAILKAIEYIRAHPAKEVPSHH